MRTVHGGLEDLAPLVRNVTPEMKAQIDLEPYSAEQFREDILRLGKGQPDPKLVEAVVSSSRDAIQWLAESVQVPFVFLSYGIK